MIFVKFSLGIIVTVAVCLYQYLPGPLPEMDVSIPSSRDATVFALIAGALFLVSLVPVRDPELLANMALTRLLQLTAAIATFLAAMQLLGGFESTFSFNQYLALWGLVIVGLIAAAISYVAFMLEPFRRAKGRGK